MVGITSRHDLMRTTARQGELSVSDRERPLIAEEVNGPLKGQVNRPDVPLFRRLAGPGKSIIGRLTGPYDRWPLWEAGPTPLQPRQRPAGPS